VNPCAWCTPKPDPAAGESLTLSHGICDACITKHFPDLVEPRPTFRRILAGKLSRGFVELRGRAAAGVVRVLRRGGPASW
jgi:hypothetical protein